MLYLRSRLVGRSALTLAFTFLAAWGLSWFLISQQISGVGHGGLTPIQLLATLLAACILGASIHSPFGDAERTVAYTLSPLRLGHLSGLLIWSVLLLVIALLAFDLHGARPAYPFLVLVRNLVGFTGLALLTARLLGARISWILPVALGISPFVLLVASRNAVSRTTELILSWQLQSGGDKVSWTIALVLFAAGLGLICIFGPQEPADEAE